MCGIAGFVGKEKNMKKIKVSGTSKKVNMYLLIIQTTANVIRVIIFDKDKRENVNFFWSFLNSSIPLQ